eukprot:g15017.t1
MPDSFTLAQYAVYFTTAFMVLPAGRDVVATGQPVMPGDEGILAIMFDDYRKPGWHFMWQLWGINWLVLSAMKAIAVREWCSVSGKATGGSSSSSRGRSPAPSRGKSPMKGGGAAGGSKGGKGSSFDFGGKWGALTAYMKLALVHDLIVVGKLVQDFAKFKALGADMGGFLFLFTLELVALVRLSFF